MPIKIAGKDITLNVSFKEALVRFGVILVLPMILLLIDKRLIVYATPVMAYLFITGLTRFCIIKYGWDRYVRHKSGPVLSRYEETLDYPEESVSQKDIK